MVACESPRILLFISLVASCLFTLLTGCASITGSKNQPVSVNAVCDGQAVIDASCTLMNDKGSWYVKTPGSVMIQKAYGDLAVDWKKGDALASAKFTSSSNGGVWGNILAGGIIGYAIDANSGAGFDYPSTMTVNLPPPCSASSKRLNAYYDRLPLRYKPRVFHTSGEFSLISVPKLLAYWSDRSPPMNAGGVLTKAGMLWDVRQGYRDWKNRDFIWIALKDYFE